MKYKSKIGLQLLCLISLFSKQGKYFMKRRFQKFLLLFITLLLIFLIFEIIITLRHKSPNEKWQDIVKRSSKDQDIEMPIHLQKRPVRIEGAHKAYYWHSHLHVFDQNRMRRTKPFPIKTNKFRIMAVGDSLTYGEGIAIENTYSYLLEQELLKEYQAEVLNLGVKGNSSRDIIQCIKSFGENLKPDLIFYGVCLNDYQPSYWLNTNKRDLSYAFPLPNSVKEFFIGHTMTGKFFYQIYNRALIKVGLRARYRQDVQQNAKKHQLRFIQDMKKINQLSKDLTQKNAIAMILNQYPISGDLLTQKTENIIKDSGINLIPSKKYYQENHNKDFKVSIWEGHPNEEANFIFFKEILPTVKATIPIKFKKNSP